MFEDLFNGRRRRRAKEKERHRLLNEPTTPKPQFYYCESLTIYTSDGEFAYRGEDLEAAYNGNNSVRFLEKNGNHIDFFYHDIKRIEYKKKQLSETVVRRH